MGTKRIEGRQKRKSVKAKVTTLSNEKKRLSRFGKKVTKGLQGPSTDFVTRSAVLKKLQITLKDFRRLCILKGIYPRVPDKAPPKGADKIYYDIKDIMHLSHEPLLNKFREFKSFMKKVRHEAGKFQFAEAQRKYSHLKPAMNMDHLVKERYPRFIDAIRDLDDCLCMIFLFSSLPSKGRVTVEKTRSCQELVKQWSYYIARSKLLSKVFVSVKGFYCQSVIMGETVTWLQPHQFTQVVPKEIDIRVMTTFLDFYEILMKFILYKLYHMEGLQYPPQIDKSLHEAGCFLLSVKATPIDGSNILPIENSTIPQVDNDKSNINNKESKKIQEKIDSITKELNDDEEDEALDETVTTSLKQSLHGLFENNEDDRDEDEKHVFAQPVDVKETNKIFSKLKFFVNREVPLEWMQLCIISFGGVIGWDDESSPFDINDPSITHQIIDRPLVGTSIIKSREYIQPQWIFDSINASFLLPTSRYQPGSILPPHLSPFVDDDKEGYIPKYRQELESIKSSLETQLLLKSNITINRPESLDEDEVDDDEVTHQKNVKAEKSGKLYSKAKETKDPIINKNKIEESESDDNSDEEEVDEPVTQSNKGVKGVVFKPKDNKQTEVSDH